MKKRKIGALLLALMMIFSLSLAACNNDSGTTTGGTSDTDGATSTTDNANAGNANNGSTDSGNQTTGSGDLVERGYQSDMAKDEIIIRAVRPESGSGAIFEQTAFGPQYKMWEDMINQEGGLYVKSLDRRVPVRIITYDDASDMDATTRLFEQIVSRDKPDLILAPESTARLFACAPIAQRYGYLLLAAEGGALALAEQFDTIREDYGSVNTFAILSYSHTQVPALVKFLDQEGIDSVYCAYINDLHGLEYWEATERALNEVGIEIKGSEPVDPDNVIADTIINNAKASGAQAFLSYTYPQQSIPIAQSAVQLEFNPDVYLVGPGGCYDFFGLFAFGDSSNQALHGMMGWGAWNEKSSDAARAYSQMFRQYWIDKGLFWKNADGSDNPNGTVYQDWWGHICYYSVMQILQQAVENAGELDENGIINQATLIEYVGSATFDTVMHPQLRFNNNILEDEMYLGNIGQWQNGVFEVVDADGRRTADPIIPKPPWNIGG